MKKNKKIIMIIIAILLIVAITVAIIIGANKKTNEDNEPKTLLEEVLKIRGKSLEENDYKKFVGGEVLNEDTAFLEYAFLSNNKVYIFDPAKLKKGELSYRKVYDIPENIRIMNINPSLGTDIGLISYDDIYYYLDDENLDNKGAYYVNFENSDYHFKKFYSEKYSLIYQKENFDYDFISNYWYAKDNILYTFGAPFDYNREKISGNYEGEKIIRIYNERIVKTDKGFYEVVVYSDNGRKISTMRINLLTKYHDEVLTFTYEYVILKDYTMIPINDVMPNRPQKYQYNYYWGGLNEKPNSFEE